MITNTKGQVVRNDLSGLRFGNVIVQPKWYQTTNGGTKWLVECQCDQKNHWWVWAEVLKRSPTICCRVCRNKILAAQHTTHGKRYTAAYACWKNMMDRCYDVNHKSYPIYGGRGITVCERWHKFENWYADNGDPPPGKTLDRTNNYGNYEPGNCEWKTRKEQANNRRTNKYLTAFGETHTYSEWSEITGIEKSTIRKRVLLGWPPEKCLSPIGCRSLNKAS